MQAVIQYGKIVSWLEMEYGLSEKESKASESFLLAAFLNLAMCYLKLREYNKAVECCDKVGEPHLTLCPCNPFRLFLSGQHGLARQDGAFYGCFNPACYRELLAELISLHPYPAPEDENRRGAPSFLLYVLFAGLGIEPRALCMLGKHYH